MTVLDIWNAALAMLPHDRRINSIEENSTEALRMRDAWDSARQYVIASAEWGWLVEQDVVCPSQAHSPIGMYQYPRPMGAIRVLGLFDNRGRRIQAQSVDGMLLSRYQASSVRYIRDNTDVEMWPSWFTDAVVTELASRVAGSITGSMQQAKVLEAKAMLMLEKAKQIDAQEIAYSGTDGRTYARSRNGDLGICEL